MERLRLSSSWKLAALGAAALGVLSAPGVPGAGVPGVPGQTDISAMSIPLSRAESPWLPGDHTDYAPSGVPDFSQCRGAWSLAGAPPQWTHAGPVALTDALWWLDSAAEPSPVAPPTANDGHALVTAYPYFGPARDDHVAANLTLLVEDLALRAHTNGVGLADAGRGTRWRHLVAAAQNYVGDRGLLEAYDLTTTERPTTSWIADAVARQAGTVLLLGVWELQGNAWRRVGGHYVSLAGASEDGQWVAFSDPLLDAAAHGGDGRIVPEGTSSHSCREAPREHDDARLVAHDRYQLYDVPSLPDGRLGLAGYFTLETFGDAAAYRDQNRAAFLDVHAGTWAKGSVVMAIDAGLSIVPHVPPEPSATSNPGDTPPPTAPAQSATPARTVSATASPPTTGTRPPPTAAAPPTAPEPGTPTPKPRPTTRRTYLPISLS